MTVNSQKVPVLLDSGSVISIVPADMVAQAQMIEEKAVLRGYGAEEDLVLPMARIPFEANGSKWEELVAVSPVGGQDEEVLFSLNIGSSRGLELVQWAHRKNWKKKEKVKEEVVEEKEEEVVEEEEEEEKEEMDGKVYRCCRVRRIAVIKYFNNSDSGMVGGNGGRLEASQQPIFVSYCDYNFLSFPEESMQLDQTKEQPRAAAISFGGDVGTAHRRQRDRDKEKGRKDKD